MENEKIFVSHLKKHLHLTLLTRMDHSAKPPQLCGCTKDLPDEYGLSSDTDAVDMTAGTSSSSDEQTEMPVSWEPDLTKNYNFSLVLNENDTFSADYDLVLSLDIDTFSISEIPEKINLTIVNQTDKTFHMCTVIHLEKLYAVSAELEDEHIDIDYHMGKGWVRVPFTTNEKVSFGTTMRADVTYLILIEKNLKENFKLSVGKYRFVFYSAVGSHYAYFEITE